MRIFQSFTRFPTTLALVICSCAILRAGTPPVSVDKSTEKTEEPVSLDIFKSSITAISPSEMPLPHRGSIEQEVLAPTFEYTHRISMSGPWYFALGASYEGFFFGKTKEGLPESLQGMAGIIALDYIVQNHVAMTIELRPGFYTAGDFRNSFDIPVLVYAPIPLRSNLFLMLGARESTLQKYIVVPIGGVIWLINDHLRLEGVFPRPELIYSPGGKWEYQIGGEIAGDGYRMDRDPALPEKLRGAVVEYLEYRAGVGATYTVWKGATVGLTAGYVFERSLDFFRADKHLDSGGGFYTQLQAGLEF
jgi:hypothetical protein